MKEKARKAIVYGILVVAVIWGIYNNPLSPESKNDPVPDSAPMSSVSTQPLEEPTKASKTSDDVALIAWNDDPFTRNPGPPVRAADVQPERKPPRFHVTAISGSGKAFMAIVDGKVLREGERLGGWAVAEIDRNSVMLHKGSDRIELKLKER